MKTLSPLVFCLLHRAGRSASYFGVRLIVLLPRRWWYPALWRISRVEAVLIWPILHLGSFRMDHRRSAPLVWILNHWIRRIISVKGEFPIPVRVKGSELIHNLYGSPRGAVVCSGHVPLIDICLQYLMQMGCPPTLTVAAPEAFIESRIPLWGKPALPGVPSGHAVLLKVRTVLRRGGFVAALVDHNSGETYSPNLFRVVQLTGAKVVFTIPELRANGDIDIEFFLPPDPSCQTEESICLNLRVLQSRVDHVLRRTPPPEKPTPPVPVSSIAQSPPDT
jgi:hypothetical protein